MSLILVISIVFDWLHYPEDTAALKLALNVWGATIGYGIDLAACPYARPHDMLDRMKEARDPTDRLSWSIAFAATVIRRVGLMAVAIYITGMGV